MPAHPAICLNAIVRNEAHIIHEMLDAVAPHVSCWVIVDTGSTDGTQDIIRNRMSELGIPGELHERPWRNFGHNRSEALALAQGHGDYIWVMDADDTITGTIDFTGLSADIIWLRFRDHDTNTFWRPQIFRDGVPVRYEGVVHEYLTDDVSFDHAHLDGDYHVESRRLGARNTDLERKHASDRDLLLAEVQRNPGDSRSVFYLAQSYFCLNDYASAREWYARRAEMGGWDEEVFYSLLRVAVSMAELGESWPQVLNSFLLAYEKRPSRAEPLYEIARWCRRLQRYEAGYMFAKRAAEIPCPDDIVLVAADVHNWRALDEQAVCASWINKKAEAFALWRRILARPDIPDDDRSRMAANLDLCKPSMIDAASRYPEALAQHRFAGPRDPEVTVSLVAGPDRADTDLTLNSFLNSCTDMWRVGRFLVVDAGLSAVDRANLLERYSFLEFVDAAPGSGPGTELAYLRAQIHGRFWLHLGQGWLFFAPEDLIARLTAVLKAEPQVFQVAINGGETITLSGASAAADPVRRAPGAGRYVLGERVAYGPAMFDTALLDRLGGISANDPDPLAELNRRAVAAGLATASLDELLCIQPDPR
ncbi:glycosyl transferase [Mycobacterium intermedium]|uniref:Glycosyl transferase n=1 Tax=Mycobacterium intermedium TaxID=28445 RepID=A0A1E3S255_MYCIE|nr:glycosyltransferase [Mycobacterium intermedium]ODQ96209.1 glycosyl transferase [Mycobacterium intermedium]OPE46534.1 glycosyl transferase [Mycobacterium intermedium]ORA94800.1 glycosyl transferase [Mycobacterium intermedium]